MMGEALVTVGVDKIKVGLVFPDQPTKQNPHKDNYQGIMEWVGSVRTNDFAPIAGGRKRTFRPGKPPAAWTFASQPLASGGAIGCRYGRHKWAFRAWVEFNPSVSNVGELALLFCPMLEQGFETFNRFAHVAYCEIYVDVVGARFEDYLFIDAGLRTACNAYVKDGTQYLGSVHGARRLSIYDKAKQLAEVFGVTHDDAVLRIEAKLRTHFPMSTLLNIANPFQRLLVFNRKLLEDSPRAGALKLADLVGMGLSAQAAFGMLSHQQRADVMTHHVELTPLWWQPQVLFARLPEACNWIATLRHAGITGEIPPLGAAGYASLATAAAKNPLVVGWDSTLDQVDANHEVEASS